MQLFYTPNSPYARKCRIVAMEKGVHDRIELVDTPPADNPPELLAANPLGRVPALRTDSGLLLCESPVICEYLDSLAPEPQLYADRFCVLAFNAMADGIMDAAVACVLEGRRPEEKQWQPWIERKEQQAMRTIAKIAGIPMEGSPLSIGTISTAVALDYVSFRLPHLEWEKAHPVLAKWRDGFVNRLSFQQTKPAA